MNAGNTNVPAEIPVPEAADLVAYSLRSAVPLQMLVGYFVILGAYGALHPYVVDFERSHGGTPLIRNNGESV